MIEIQADSNLVAYCGLYCGACKKYLNGKCPGCKQNEKASWCKVRSCNIEKKYNSCAECSSFNDVMDCKKFNNFMSKIMSLIFRSDRKACIEIIKSKGRSNYASHMCEIKAMTIKK